MEIDPKKILAKLVEKKIISPENAAKFEQDAVLKKIPLEQYLLMYAKLPNEELLRTKSELINVPYINITSTAIDPQALNFVPKNIATEHHILPYLHDPQTKQLYVATANPLNIGSIEYLSSKAGIKIVPVLASETEIMKMLNIAYSLNLSPIVKEAVADISNMETNVDSIQTTSQFNAAPIAKIVNTTLEFGIKSRASDIHIEPHETNTRVRYRIDGILIEKLSLPRSIHESLISRIKILGGMKIDEKRIPQDGRMNYKLGDEEVDLRISSLPTVFGEKMVMRLLRKSGGLPALKELGLEGVQLKRFEEGISRSYGIVLVTGPTGSGKTTTLYSVLSRLNTAAVNIVTLEDPVEYQMDGINQVQVNPQAGLTFATGLKSFLRQDPNIILVGEIRDKETTQLAIQAALTGHLVFSTLHTNDAATAIPRLIDLGGEPFLIASVLNVTMGQRIVRKVCDHCKEEYEPSIEVQSSIKTILGPALPKIYADGQPIKLSRGKGCDECNHSGYLGRVGIFEILRFSPAISKLVMSQSSSQDIEAAARSEGMVLLKQDGYLKALVGITTIEEVMRVTEA
jgi:type IV pilus assembly protein PilB